MRKWIGALVLANLGAGTLPNTPTVHLLNTSAAGAPAFTKMEIWCRPGGSTAAATLTYGFNPAATWTPGSKLDITLPVGTLADGTWSCQAAGYYVNAAGGTSRTWSDWTPAFTVKKDTIPMPPSTPTLSLVSVD